MLGPIFSREWLTLPRRPQHYAMRSALLGVLWLLGLTAWQVVVGWTRPATLGDTARFGQLLFQSLAYLILVGVLFFGALAAALAVAQEKVRRTFVLLLVTDLRNHELVLGKLLASLLPLGLLLLGSVPVLALGLLLGGVGPGQLACALLILAAAGLFAGSLGCLVALWRDQTFQALALTVLFLVLYGCLVRGLALVPTVADAWSYTVSPETWERAQLWLDPFQCLQVVLNPPTETDMLLAPPVGFAVAMLLLSGVVNAWSIARLRVWNPGGEPIMQREQPATAATEPAAQARTSTLAGAADSRRWWRRVWANPILWREIRTRAYGTRPLLVKAAYFLVLGLLCYYVLVPLPGPGPFVAAHGLLPVTILGLLLTSAQAVTAITSERDKGALDLLLVTDLSPREFVFGKLLGICYNSKEYLLPPLLLAGAYAYLGLLATPPRGHEELRFRWNLLAAVCSIGTIVVLLAFVMVLGLHIGLRTRQSGLAVSHTLGAVFFLSAGTLLCIGLIVISGRFEYQWGSFVLFVGAGIGGMWWVLNGDRPSRALTIASVACPLAVFYAVMNLLIGKPGSEESSNPLLPFLVLTGAFGFAMAAMLIPLLSEFDVALGRTTGPVE